MHDPYADLLRTAETQLRDAVSRLGNTHPEVLAMLEQYIAILRQIGQTEKADKLAIKAKDLRAAIAAKAAQEAGGTTAAPAPAPAAPAPAPAPAAIPAAAPAGLTEEELAAKAEAEAQAKAEERAKARAAAAAALEEKARLAREAREAEDAKVADSGTPDLYGVDEIYLFNSNGEHVAVAYKGALYLPDGKNIGRWDDGLEAFLDRRGWYLGQIVQSNRLAKDVNWPYRHMSFGDKGNEGNISGWSRQSDENRVILERDWEDVEIPDA